MAPTLAPVIILKCRLCLGESNESNMRALFEEDNGSGKDEPGSKEHADASGQHLSQKVEFCCGIKVRQSPQMPSNICDRCYEFMRMWYKFRQMCLNSQVYLESSCLDGEKPDELIHASDSEYMEYLYEMLQMNAEPATHTTRYDEAAHTNDEIEMVESSDYVANEAHEVDQSPEMLITVMEPYEGDDRQYADDNQTAENCIAVHEEAGNYVLNDDEEEEDFLSPTPSPEPRASSTASRRKPGRPRKPENELKSKRKSRGSGQPQNTNPPGEEPESKYMCTYCGNVYQKKSAFTAHMTAHSDYKPHQCELCLKSFRQVGELRAHIRRHTGERPFKCLYCDRYFYDRSEKVRHERVHTNTRPYMCKECGKTFTHTAILKNHMLVHSGEKNYNCSICSKSFTLLHQLKAHLQTLTHKTKANDPLAGTATAICNYMLEKNA